MDDEEHKAACLARWKALETEARNKWSLFRRKRISRNELEGWLKQQRSGDEATIRKMFNRMRG